MLLADRATTRQRRPPVVASEAATLDTILRDDLLTVHLQPIVEIGSSEVLGYEALARGPAGSPLESPLAMFEAAARFDRVAELDRRCVAQAFRTAHRLGIPRSHALFVNVEPTSLLDLAQDPELASYAGAGTLVVEFLERDLADRPADLIAAATLLRRQGVRIALDDVGTHEDSITFMPLLRPDIIKLDRSLIIASPDGRQASDIGAILAEAERTGCTILGEGIETDAHEHRAIAFGARLGQGWRYGRPSGGPGVVATRAHLPSPTEESMVPSTPVDVAFTARTPRIAAKRDLLAFSRHLEGWASASDERPMLLATFQTDARFTPGTRRRYAELASRCSLVGAMGVGLDEHPAPGIRGWSLAANDELVGQWNVLVVGRHIAGALIARDLGGAVDDEMDRQFEFVITYDRTLVVDAARSLMARVIPFTR